MHTTLRMMRLGLSSSSRVYNRRCIATIVDSSSSSCSCNSSSSSSSVEGNNSFRFEVLHRSMKEGSKARVGRIHTPHGIVDTPGFVPVGTNAALKYIPMSSLKSSGLQLMFANTYHLMLQPGTDKVGKGLHSFTGYNGPLITDSGGFQVFSLHEGARSNTEPMMIKNQGAQNKHTNNGSGSVLKINEDGVKFRSYRDGSILHLSPESSVQAQKHLGADIILPLDELPLPSMNNDELIASMERTHRWELRSLAEHIRLGRQEQAMYGIIHGGTLSEQRENSTKLLREAGFDGFAIGGNVGKDTAELMDVVGTTTGLLPPDAPVHLLGVADLTNILSCTPFGVDTFDACYPTRIGRHGKLILPKFKGTVSALSYFKGARDRHDMTVGEFFAELSGILKPDCTCPMCTEYSPAYLHHLFSAHEPIALQLGSTHNLYAMATSMRDLRDAIYADEV